MVVAVMLGVVFLKERFNAVRRATTNITLIGTAALRVPRSGGAEQGL